MGKGIQSPFDLPQALFKTRLEDPADVVIPNKRLNCVFENSNAVFKILTLAVLKVVHYSALIGSELIHWMAKIVRIMESINPNFGDQDAR